MGTKGVGTAGLAGAALRLDGGVGPPARFSAPERTVVLASAERPSPVPSGPLEGGTRDVLSVVLRSGGWLAGAAIFSTSARANARMLGKRPFGSRSMARSTIASKP